MSGGAFTAAAADGVATTPSHTVLVRAGEANLRAGHENLGFLSAAHGLMPSAEPRLRLPATHRTWDHLAAELPQLHGRLAVRRAVDALPVLPAGADALPEEYLLRAGALLGILAHAYWWADRQPPTRLPAGVALPWRTVSRRLGRPAPHLSYVDLVVYNWRLVEPGTPRTVRNMRLLVPTVDNEAEHVFYLTQAEILARCTPVVDAVVRAQAATRADDPETLLGALDTIAAGLDEVTRGSLPKISPVTWSATHVDPVLWARTVAPFGVPIDASTPGPSGTSSPIFHVLDAFFGRATYRSRIGREMSHLHEWHPRHWRDFVAAVRRTPVRDYVQARGHPPLRTAYDEALARYAGEAGFLGRHRLKVYGYLELAFKVGRTVTIGGFAGPFRDRTWNEVDAELTAAAAERRPGGATGPPAATGDPSTPDGRRVARSRLVSHNDDRSGYWIAVDGAVYDVTALRGVHPGGVPVLDAHAGTDATAVFHRIGHHRSGRVAALAHRYRIGTLDPEPRSGRELYRSWIRAAYLVTEMENAFRIDHPPRPPADGGTALALRYRSEVHGRFVSDHLDAVTGEIPDGLWRRTVAACRPAGDPGWMVHQLSRIRRGSEYAAVIAAADLLAADVRALGAATGPAADRTARRLDDRCRLLQETGAAVLGSVKEVVRVGAEVLERGDVHPARDDELTTVLRRLPGVVARYCRDTAAGLRRSSA